MPQQLLERERIAAEQQVAHREGVAEGVAEDVR